MVSDAEKYATPRYSLQAMQDLTAIGAIAYAGPTVERDIQNLGYSDDDVCHCIRILNSSDFRESAYFDDTRIWCDVYRITVRAFDRHSDDLYIKLKLNRNCTQVVICSFHRPRT